MWPHRLSRSSAPVLAALGLTLLLLRAPASETLEAAGPSLSLQAAPRGQAVAAAPAAAVRRLAVVDLDSETASLEEVRAASQAFVTAFERSEEVAVLPLSASRARLLEVGLLPRNPYQAPPSPPELARILGVEWVITGSLNRTGDEWRLAAQMFNARSNAVENRVARDVPGGFSSVLAAIPDVATALRRGTPLPAAPSQQRLESLESQLAASQREGQRMARQVEDLRAELADTREQLRQAREELQLARAAEEVLEPVEPAVTPEPIETPTTAPTETPVVAPVVPTTAPVTASPQDKARAAELARDAQDTTLDAEARIELLRQAVELDPATASYWQELAVAHFRQRDFDAARGVLDEALEQFPANVDLMTIKGASYFEQSDYARAERLFREALSVDPRNAYAQFNLAQTIQESNGGRDDEALAAWRRYMEIAPLDPRQERQGWVERAREMMARLPQPSPTPTAETFPVE